MSFSGGYIYKYNLSFTFKKKELKIKIKIKIIKAIQREKRQKSEFNNRELAREPTRKKERVFWKRNKASILTV